MIDIGPFARWLARQVFKYGRRLPAMLRWMWANRARVSRWLASGLSYATIAGLIFNILF